MGKIPSARAARPGTRERRPQVSGRTGARAAEGSPGSGGIRRGTRVLLAPVSGTRVLDEREAIQLFLRT